MPNNIEYFVGTFDWIKSFLIFLNLIVILTFSMRCGDTQLRDLLCTAPAFADYLIIKRPFVDCQKFAVDLTIEQVRKGVACIQDRDLLTVAPLCAFEHK